MREGPLRDDALFAMKRKEYETRKLLEEGAAEAKNG